MSESTETFESEERPQQIISQRNYTPTPFVTAEWEMVGEQVAVRDFVPADIEILDVDASPADPMFDVFEDSQLTPGKKIWHSNDGQEVQEVYSEQVVGVAEEEVERLVQEAYQKGLKEGQEAAVEQAREEATEKQRQLEQGMQTLTSDLNAKVGEAFSSMEKNALDFALAVAKKILKTTADVKPESIYEIIRAGLGQLGASKPMRIRVSAADHEFIEVVGLPEDLQREDLAVEYVIDENIEAGCVIETDFGEIDLQLDHMWAEVADNIFDEGSQ